MVGADPVLGTHVQPVRRRGHGCPFSFGRLREAQQRGVAAFSVLGGSAAAGVAVLPVVALANLRAVRARRARAPLSRAIRLGSVGLWLTLLRLAGLVVAGAVLIAATGVTGESVLTDGCALGLALVDGLFAVLVASVTHAGLRRGAA